MSETYNRSFYSKHVSDSLNSAAVIVPLILQVFPVRSVNDVGCGTGGWLQTFQRAGVQDIRGWDANSMEERDYAIDKDRIKTDCDFSSSDFKINCPADICISLEVAEHLPEQVADHFVGTLVSCSQVVIFSAAYPGQTGVNHVNEQPPWYWRNKFNQHGYVELDYLRPLIWKNEQVSWWYRQNITSFVHPDYIKKNDAVLSLFKEFGQKNTPHRLTLVNEWILNRHTDNQSMMHDERMPSQSNLSDLHSNNTTSQEKMIIDLADHLLRLPLTPVACQSIAQVYAKYNYLEISNTLLAKSNSNVNEPISFAGEDEIGKRDCRPQITCDSTGSNCKVRDEHTIDSSYLESIPSHLSANEKTQLHRLASLKAHDGAVFVELGSYLGGSSCYIAEAIQSSQTDTHFYCIDTWWNEGMSEGLRDTYAEFQRNTSPFKDFIIPLRGKTDQVVSYFKKKIDFLFIDADHSYEAVSRDIHNWIPLLKEDAIIAFHDYTWFEGVKRAIEEHLKPVEAQPGTLIDSLYVTKVDITRVEKQSDNKKLLFIMPALERIYYYNPIPYAFEPHSKIMPNVSGLFIGSYLQRFDIDVSLFDFVEYYRKDNALTRERLWQYLKTRIDLYTPDLIAMNVWPQTLEICSYFTSLIKQQFPNLNVIWGGHFVALATNKELMESPADLFVKYGGEIPLQKLLAGKPVSEVENVHYKSARGIESTHEKIFTDHNYDLDLNWSLIDVDSYFKPVMDLEAGLFTNTAMTVFNRGCPNRCNFCVAQNGTFPKPVWLSNHSLSREIVKLCKQNDIEHVHITDDLTFRNNRNLEDFIGNLQTTDVFGKVNFTISTRADRLKDKEYLRNLEKAGVVSVRVGIESDSEPILNKMDKRSSSAYNWTIMRNAYDSSIKHIYMMINGYLDETRTDAMRSIQFLMRNLNISSRYWVSKYQLYRGTHDYENNSHRITCDNFSAMPDAQAKRYDQFIRSIELVHNIRFSIKSLVDIYSKNDPQVASLMALPFKGNRADYFHDLSVDSQFFIEQNRLWRKYYQLDAIPEALFNEFHDTLLLLYLSKRLKKLMRLIEKHAAYFTSNPELLTLMVKMAFYDGKPNESIAMIDNYSASNPSFIKMRRFIKGFEAYTRRHSQFLLAEYIPFLKKGKSGPYLSVIIPTRNRAELLGKALESLTVQTYPNELFEVVVVDNGSKDHTAAVCKQYEGKFKRFRYVFDSQPGLHTGRHRGMQEAIGEILVFGDDDIRAMPSWLDGVADGFSRPDVVMVGGKILPDLEISPPEWYEKIWSRCQWGPWLGWYSLLDFGDSVIEVDPGFIWGCNFSIRKETLLEVGGFHPDSLPKHLLRFRGDGETAVSAAVAKRGYKAIYHPSASVYHWVSKERLTPEYLYQRAFSQGISDSFTAIRSNTKASEEKKFVPCNDDIKNMIQQGYCDGFNFHQLEARKDPQLLDWITRESYVAGDAVNDDMDSVAIFPAHQAALP